MTLPDWLQPGLVFLGGGLGSAARYAIAKLAASDHFPWHTLAINIAGSFLLGLVATAYRDRPTLALLLGTGFCGGFTTFSTFSLEALDLLDRDRPGAAATYIGTSIAASILAAAIAVRLARGN